MQDRLASSVVGSQATDSGKVGMVWNFPWFLDERSHGSRRKGGGRICLHCVELLPPPRPAKKKLSKKKWGPFQQDTGWAQSRNGGAAFIERCRDFCSLITGYEAKKQRKRKLIAISRNCWWQWGGKHISGARIYLLHFFIHARGRLVTSWATGWGDTAVRHIRHIRNIGLGWVSCWWGEGNKWFSGFCKLRGGG